MADEDADPDDGPAEGSDPADTQRRDPPPTEEGWYALHDLRRVDWGAWRDAPARERDRAIREGVEFLGMVAEPEEGTSAAFTVTGHKADLLVLHLRPALDDLNAIERSFERTALAAFTERADSFVSVTEVSGYMSEGFFEEDGEAGSEGMARYVRSRLEPSIPEADYVSFYPMDKRRGGEYNWYDLPFEERAELMSGHGNIGRYYAGDVTQIITSAIGLDDWEWGVTLFSDDPTEIKQLLYEMRFDPSSSRYAEFGTFYVGQRFPPSDLRAVLAGERVPTGEAAPGGGTGPGVGAGGDADPPEATAVSTGVGGEPAGPHPSTDPDGVGDADPDPPHGDPSGRGAGGVEGKGEIAEHAGSADPAGTDPEGGGGGRSDRGIRGELEDMGVYAGQPHGEDVYAVVVYSEADGEELFDELRGLRANFDHYDTHVKTAVYEAGGDGEGEVEAEGAREEGRGDEGVGDLKAVASVWETQSAADTAGGFLSDLPGVVRQAGDDPEGDTWGTMGMFYTVDPEHREAFHGKFGTVADLLEDVEGHVRTDLLVNREDEDDMFIASRWESREDATAFFRSEEFAETVDWGRDVLVDRPRHVFLA